MAKAGRKPKPDVLKVLQGTYRKDRANENQPTYDDNEIQVPAHYDDAHKEKWLDIVPQLVRSGVAKNIDMFILEMMIDTLVDLADAQAELRKGDPVTTAKTGYRQLSADFTIVERLKKSAMDYFALFGMDPSSRTKIVADTGKKKSKRFTKVE